MPSCAWRRPSHPLRRRQEKQFDKRRQGVVLASAKFAGSGAQPNSHGLLPRPGKVSDCSQAYGSSSDRHPATDDPTRGRRRSPASCDGADLGRVGETIQGEAMIPCAAVRMQLSPAIGPAAAFVPELLSVRSGSGRFLANKHMTNGHVASAQIFHA